MSSCRGYPTLNFTTVVSPVQRWLAISTRLVTTRSHQTRKHRRSGRNAGEGFGTDKSQYLWRTKKEPTFGSCCVSPSSFLPANQPSVTARRLATLGCTRSSSTATGCRPTRPAGGDHLLAERPRLDRPLPAPRCRIGRPPIVHHRRRAGATDAHGIADFATLQQIVSKRQEDGLALWAFDLLHVSGRDGGASVRRWRIGCAFER